MIKKEVIILKKSGEIEKKCFERRGKCAKFVAFFESAMIQKSGNQVVLTFLKE